MEPYYIDIFPSLWGNLEVLINEGRLFAPREVLTEIQDKYDDGWNRWAKEHTKMFLDKKEIMTIVGQLQVWYPKLTNESDSKTDADYFVIALAQYMGKWTVVTEESRKKKNKLKIPHVWVVNP